jgi:hypothetical protein
MPPRTHTRKKKVFASFFKKKRFLLYPRDADPSANVAPAKTSLLSFNKEPREASASF